MPEMSGLLMSHAILLLDGSGSMEGKETVSGSPKHRAVAKMVQELINAIKDDPEIDEILLTTICYDGNKVDDIRIQAYDIKASDEYYKPSYTEDDLNKWDPLVGHRGSTPIGRALRFGRELAESWVLSAPQGVLHRAVICLLTDGMNYPASEPDGKDERNKTAEFNAEQDKQLASGGEYKGYIRIATVGYYQFPEGQSSEEDSGRSLLKHLAFAPGLPHEGSFVERDAKAIAKFLKSTVAALSQGK